MNLIEKKNNAYFKRQLKNNIYIILVSNNIINLNLSFYLIKTNDYIIFI